jgi:ribosome biogenesis protein ENP2
VKIYDLSSGKTLPEYMDEAKKKKIKLKQLDEYRNRIELIQDFEFQSSCQKVRASEGSTIY